MNASEVSAADLSVCGTTSPEEEGCAAQVPSLGEGRLFARGLADG